MMNLFEKQLGEIISTKKLSLQGQIKIFDVYRIPLEFLRYNKKNRTDTKRTYKSYKRQYERKYI